MRRQFYTSFAGVEIPPANRKEDISSHEAKSGIIETCGGYVDGYTDYAPVSAKTISVTFDLVNDDIDELDLELESWKSLTAKKDKLYRRIGRTVQWAYARLMTVEAETDYQRHWGICEVELTFELISPYWYGHSLAAWYYDDGSLWDDGLYFDQGNSQTGVLIGAGASTDIALLNRGNMNVNDLLLNIDITSGSAGKLEFTGLIDEDVIWHFLVNKTLAVNSSLELDAAKKLAKYTVSGTTEKIYKLIEIQNDHRSMSWAEIRPGNNVMRITNRGTSSVRFDIVYDFVDKWR